MTLRTALLPVADLVRGLASPETLSGGTGLDVWINTLTIRTRTWPGRPGEGVPTDTDLLLVPNPLLRQVTQREVAGSGGRYTTEDLMVEHITPAYVKDSVPGGYAPTDLVPVVTSKSVEIFYVVAGPLAGEFSCIGSSFADPTEYKLTLRRSRTTPR